MRRPAGATAASLAIAAVLLAGCGGSEDSYQSTTPASPQQEQTQPAEQSGGEQSKSATEPKQDPNDVLHRVDQGSHSG